MSDTCIDIAVRRVGDTLSFDLERSGKGLSFRIERKGLPIAADVRRSCGMPFVAVSRAGNPMLFKCGIVCSVRSEFYLHVKPEVIWLLPDNADVAVYSNVTWTIE